MYLEGLGPSAQTNPDNDVNPHLANHYNALMSAFYEEVRDFIQMHYYTSNRPEPYWLAARKDLPLSDWLREKFELWGVRLPDDTDTRANSLFRHWNYTVVMQPKGWFKNLRFPLDSSISKEQWNKFGHELGTYRRELLRILPDHYTLLQDIRGSKSMAEKFATRQPA